MLYEITFSCKYFNILLQCVSGCAHFQLWMEASHPRMLLIYTYCKGPSCKTLFLQWRKYFVGITSYEVAAVLRKWRTEGQRTILRAGMIIRVSQKNQKSEFCFATNPSGFHRLDEPLEKISALQTHKRHCASLFQFYIEITMGKSAKNLIWS